MKHTPGPWEVTDDEGESDRVFVSAKIGGHYIDVALMIGFTLEKDLKANAALIAAAPTMLAALKECISRCANSSCVDGASCRACRSAEVAIAKAENRS